MAALVRHAVKVVATGISGASLLGSVASAQTTSEAAFAQFSGKDLKANVQTVRASTSGDYFFDKDAQMASTINAQGTLVYTRAKDAYGVEGVTMERRASAGFTQNFGKLTTLGVATGYVANTGLSRFHTITAGQWWNKATILTEVSYAMSNSDRVGREYLDTDGRRVVVPPRADGKTWRLGLTWLARPDLMFMGSLATSTSSDRPRSNALTSEARYFFSPTLTALHVGADRYVDTDQVGKTTDYGRVNAESMSVAIHQHLSERWIASVSRRDHFETETPRSAESVTISRRSHEYKAKVRWRYVTGPVTEDVPEIYVFGGNYYSHADQSGTNHAGIGGKYVF